MVSDKQIESNHRKHRRSSSSADEVEKSLKRHKHRRHRHHRDKKHDEIAVKDVSPSLGDPAGVGNGGELDMEEGEVLKKKLESGEIKSAQFRVNNLPVHVDTLPDDGLASDRDVHQPKVETFHSGSTRESEWGDEYPSEKNGKKSYENGRNSSSFENFEDKHKISSRSPSNTRHTADVHAQKRSRSRERERSRSRIAMEDGPTVRGRDKATYSSKERGREYERERRSEKDNDKGREIQSDREKHKTRDDGEVRHKQSRHSRHDAEDDLEMRSSNSLNGHNSKGGNSKETWGNVERSRNDSDQNDDGEVVVWELAEQEDKELNRVEESRKRMQAIMEKHKKKLEPKDGFSSHDKGKDLELTAIPEQYSNVADVLGSDTLGAGQVKTGFDIDAIDGDVAKLSSTVGESPARLVISDTDKTVAPAGLGEGIPESERSDDMFHDDMFAESPAGNRKMGYVRGKGNGVPIVRSGLHDNWDDAEGYYSYRFGELLDGRYEIMATHGKGVFSTVVRAKDTKAELAEPEEVAIKIIRNNETMHKAGQTEVQILKKLAGSDPENKGHCVRFLSSFKYRNHLCLVFESLHLNLREVLKKFGRNIGLKLSAVRVYAKQLFISLKHLKNCGVLHCDIKPDNMLVNEGNAVLKLCDFGSAMFAGKNEIKPYLVSRFYRAPEIILGLSYDHPLDIWSVGCCLYEIYSGKVLFPGSTNNDMLRLYMELKGPFPKKMLRKGAFRDQHFGQDSNFYATEEDSVTGKTIKRMMVNIKPKDFGSVIKGYAGEDPKVLVHFRDLLDKIFILDPEKRLTVSQALAHPFITGK